MQISLQLPRDLEPDFGEFKDRVAERIESGVLSIEAVQLLARFGQLVYTQVAQLSLVARGDRTVLYTRHILDSLNPLDIQSPPPPSALDIGSGGGFPGIPLAIVWPGTRVTILESREKKAGFLERAVRELGIRNVTVACGRLEEYGRSWTAEPHRAVYVRALGGRTLRPTSSSSSWAQRASGHRSCPALSAAGCSVATSLRVPPSRGSASLQSQQFDAPPNPDPRLPHGMFHVKHRIK